MTNPLPDLGEWPALDWEDWKETADTVHMWTQIVGKTRLALTPVQNHWWNVPLYVTSRGLCTSRIPYGERSFELWFDFIQHQLVLEMNDGPRAVLAEIESVEKVDINRRRDHPMRC